MRYAANGTVCEVVLTCLGLAELFDVDEEECLIATVIEVRNPYRAAERESVIVAPLAWPDQVSATVVCERVTGVQNFVNEIIVDGTMELIGSGLHGDVEKATTDLAVLSSEVTGLNGDLLNRVDAGLLLCWNARNTGAARVLSFDPVGLRVIRRSVHFHFGIGSVIGSRDDLQDRVGIANAPNPSRPPVRRRCPEAAGRPGFGTSRCGSARHSPS